MIASFFLCDYHFFLVLLTTMDTVLSEETQRLLDQVEDVSARAMLRHLVVRLAKKANSDDKRFDELFKFAEEIKSSLRHQENYSSKDSISMLITHFDTEDEEKVFINLWDFFKIFWNFDIEKQRHKAFHVLPTKRAIPGNVMQFVIVKFLYDKDKHIVYAKRKVFKPDEKKIRLLIR